MAFNPREVPNLTHVRGHKIIKKRVKIVKNSSVQNDDNFDFSGMPCYFSPCERQEDTFTSSGVKTLQIKQSEEEKCVYREAITRDVGSQVNITFFS